MDPLAEITWQFDMAWRLADVHFLPELTDDACHWLPSPGAVTVRRDDHGAWRADWIDDERGPGPTASLAWLTWHLQWWLGDAIAAARHRAGTPREEVTWPGSADGVRAMLGELAAQWRSVLADAADRDLDGPVGDSWPGPAWPLRTLFAWVDMELMKNVAEIGAGLRLYAAHHPTA